MAHTKIEEYRKSLIENQKKKQNNEDVGTRVLATGANILDNLGTGIALGLEGVVDAGATIAGQVGQIFGGDTQWASDFVANQYVNDFKNENMQDWNEYIQNSYVNELPDVWQDVINGATTSVGQMLPAIGVGLLTGGVGATITFGASAGGLGVQEGLNQGNSFNTATAYGGLQAGKEVITEYLGGKLFGSSVMGVFGSDVGEAGVKGLIKSVAKESLGEGAEEVLGGFFDPVINKVTIAKDESLASLYGDAFRQMPVDFITGALSGAFMNGGTAVTNIAQYGVDGTNAQGVVADAHELVEEYLKKEKAGTLTEAEKEQYKSDLLELSNEYEMHMKRLVEKKGFLSKQNLRMMNSTNYMKDISTASTQDLAIRDAVAKYNKANNTKINYKSLNNNEFIEAVKEIQGDSFSEADIKNANAFIDTEGNLIVNKDSQAYKEGKLYNTIGHEFIHTIEKTEGYKTLYNNFVKGLTAEQRSAMIKEYSVDRGYGNQSEEYLLQEAFADYIGENIAVNYKEFSKMLGANSKLSKIKEKLLGYKGVLNEEFRNVQTKVKDALKGNKNQLQTAKASKNKSEKGVKYERTNDFRTIQEEIGRISSEETQLFHNGSKRITEDLRGRMRGILQRQLGNSSSLYGYDLGILKNPKTNQEYKIYKNVKAEEFYDIFSMVQKVLPDGDVVDVHEIESSEWSIGYEECTCYLFDNGLSGFAITPAGDLISVFNLGEKGFLRTIKDYVISEGAKTLDCFNSEKHSLAKMYEKTLGFKTASILDFNYDILADSNGKEYADYFVKTYGEAPVHFMVRTDNEVKVKQFDKDSYDEAVEYQTQCLKEYAVAKKEVKFSKNKKNEVATTKQYEQVEGEVITENKVGNATGPKKITHKPKKAKTPLPTDSSIAFKTWANLKEKKVWNKSDVNAFFKALEQDFQKVFNQKVKIDYQGNKEEFARQLFQELNTQTNTSIEESAKNLVKNLTSITINGMSFEQHLHLIGVEAYENFINDLNTNFERLLSKGKTSQMEKVLNYYTNKVNTLAEALRLEKEYNVELRKTVHKMKTTIEKHLGKNPTYTDNAIPELNELVASLNDTLTRTDYLKHDFRDKMEAVLKAFTKNSFLVNSEHITPELISEIQQIVDNKDIYGNKRITIDEMKTIRKVCQAINKIYEEYDQAFINGKKVVASEYAKEYKNELRTKDTFKAKGIFGKLKSLFKLNFRSQLAWMSNKAYDKSLGKDIISELEKASNLKNEVYFDLTDRFVKAMNNKMLTKLNKSHFKFDGVEYTDGEIISLYMLNERGDVARRHLLGKGGKVLNEKGVESQAHQFTESELEEVRKYVESNYSNLLPIIKEIFHSKAGRYFNQTLSIRTGYENELEKNYFPMHSSKIDMASSVDNSAQLIAQYQEYLRPSFTKHIENKANNALVIKSITETVLDFSYVMSNYRAISPTIQQFNHIFNAKVNGDQTLMAYIKENVDPDFEKDLSQLLINLQGRRLKGQTNFDKKLAQLRGNVASASLGANPKVWALQLASFPLAIAELGTTSSIKGAMSGRVDYEFMKANSPYFRERFENDGVRHALLNTSNAPLSKATTAVGKVGEIASKPINFFARKLDGMVFNMSIAKVAKEKGLTINQVKANKTYMLEALALAEQVVRRTQSQNTVLETGSQLYEAGEIEKSLYMFTSDLRVIANNLAIKIHDAIVDPSTKGKLGMFVGGIISTQVLVSMLNVIARSMLGKIEDEDEDESILDEQFTEFLTGTLENSTVNMIPIAKDIYNKVIKGYDVNNMSLDVVNDVLDATTNIDQTLNGTPVEASKASYKLYKSIGTLMGIPVKNISEWSTALISNFNPEWAINSQNVLYSVSSSDIKKDLVLSYKQNRTSRVLGNMTTILSDAYLTTPNTQSSLEIARLYSKGFTQVFPTTSIESIAYDSQMYKLSKSQQQQFSKIYNEATPEIEDFISSPKYKTLSDDEKAKYIKKIYSLYYGIAKSSLIPSYTLSPTEEALYSIDASSLMYILASIDKLKASPSLSKKQQAINLINRQPISKKAKEAILAIYNYN